MIFEFPESRRCPECGGVMAFHWQSVRPDATLRRALKLRPYFEVPWFCGECGAELKARLWPRREEGVREPKRRLDASGGAGLGAAEAEAE